jgi:hypothetical protein
MANLVWRYAAGQNTLQPAMPSGWQRMDPWAMAPSIQVSSGQAMARKTSNGLGYPLNLAATDGTQTFGGFTQYSFATDASGLVYIVAAGSAAGSNYYVPFASNTPVWTGGIFDPNDVTTGTPTGTLTAEIDTVVIGGTLGATDAYTISAAGLGSETYSGGSTSTTTVALGLQTQWASNPVLTAVAVATVSANTITLTGSTAGQALSLSVGKVSTSGTITLAIATPAVSATNAEIDTWTLATNPSTGDTFSLTITYPGSALGYLGNTLIVTATVGATATVAATTVLIKNAWNNNPQAAAYATATSTSTTVVLTAAVAGSAMSVKMTSSSATTTINGNSGATPQAPTVTSPAFGRNIANILAGAPGSHVLESTGYWAVY